MSHVGRGGPNSGIWRYALAVIGVFFYNCLENEKWFLTSKRIMKEEGLNIQKAVLSTL